jgi:SAM-dependent methyltransferase
MREENLERLTELKTSINDPIYLIYKFLFQDIQDAVNQYAKGDVLDIGCGNKPYEKLFKNIGKYIGCDIVQSSDGKVDVICSVTDIPLPDNQFDTIFSTQVMEHVDDHLKMLQEAYRLTRKGGKIILTVPMAWQHHEIPHDYFRFTKYGLTYIFEKAGFKIIKIKANGGKWALLGQLTQNIFISSTRGKKSIFRKFIGLLYKAGMKHIINIWFGFLEKIDKDEDFITLNFLVVAEKP